VYEPIPLLAEDLRQYQGLLNKLVAKDPDDRFQDATELLQALKKPQATTAADPTTNATVAVAPMDAGATVVAPPAPLEPTPVTTPSTSPVGRKIPWIPIAALALTLVVVIVAFVYKSNSGPTAPSGPSGDNLTTEQRIRMQDLLQSAATFSRIGNYEQAEKNLLQVLEDFDCTNQEARRGLQALNPGAAEFVISNCGK